MKFLNIEETNWFWTFGDRSEIQWTNILHVRSCPSSFKYCHISSLDHIGHSLLFIWVLCIFFLNFEEKGESIPVKKKLILLLSNIQKYFNEKDWGKSDIVFRHSQSLISRNFAILWWRIIWSVLYFLYIFRVYFELLRGRSQKDVSVHFYSISHYLQ